MTRSAHPIRLLVLVHGYPPAVGGVEFSVRDMCEQLVAQHGFDVTVLTTNAYTISNFVDGALPTIPIDPAEERNGVRVLRFPVRAGWGPALKQAQRVAYRLRLPGNDWLRTWFNGPISPGMLDAVRRLPADVICAASFPLNHMLYPFRRTAPRPPVVLLPSVHVDEDWGFNRANLLRLVNRAFATVARTELERSWLLEHGSAPERVRVIPHGVEPGDLDPVPGAFRARHGIDPDAYLVAYVGQQGSHKGIDTLLDVLPGLLARRPDAWLVVAGARTPYSAEIERGIEALPATARERVRLLSDISAQTKADLLGDCDVFASPSRAEAFGITTLEAWSLSRAVVVGDAPSQRAILEHGRSGLLVRHGDRAGLLEALARLGDDPGERAALGRAGFARLMERYRRSDVERRQAELLAEAAFAGTGTGAVSAAQPAAR